MSGCGLKSKKIFADLIEAKTYDVNPNDIPGCVHFYGPNSPRQIFIPLCVLTSVTHFNLKQA